MTEPEPLQQVDRTFVRFRQRKLSYFSGCDYFRLASHPQVVRALTTGLNKYGLNVSASRLTTGNHRIYRELEAQLRTFFQAKDALLVSSGYLSNLVVAQALARSFSHALLDEQAHPSLADAARFLDCPILTFKHCDPEDAARAGSRCGPGARLILLTDGMFSRDGAAAPLAEYRRVLPPDAILLVDDAHGAGVLGATGKGALEHAGVNRHGFIQTITLSKAFGVFGGAVLGTSQLRRRMLDHSHCFVGSTPLPLPLAQAAIVGVSLLAKDPSLRQRLLRNTAYLKEALRAGGLRLEDTPGPIVMLPPRTAAATARLRRRLLAAGIFPPYLHYPGGPAGGYFRFVLSSEHTQPQLDRVLGAVLAR